MLLSVIMPAYNEAATIRTIIQYVAQTPYAKEIIVVDDHSDDGTPDIVHAIQTQLATQPDQFGLAPDAPACTLKLLSQQENQGKGAAIRTALGAVTGDIVLIQDADLEYNPAEYPTLLAPILDGKADVVYGSRFLGSPRRVLFFWHTVGNKLLTLVSNICTNLNLTDMETCYKVFRTEVIRDIPLRSNRFGFEPEITAKIARRGLRIYEVPISYAGRTYAEGNKINWQDGVAALWAIIRYNLLSSL
jgi:glycosyltransferase involved in cell wall biosynthesis